MPNFILILHSTYRKTGFFNISVDFERFFGVDGAPINILIGNTNIQFVGKINRTANKNRTPRIMGGVDLKNWFQTLNIMKQIKVTIINSNSIRLDA